MALTITELIMKAIIEEVEFWHSGLLVNSRHNHTTYGGHDLTHVHHVSASGGHDLTHAHARQC